MWCILWLDAHRWFEVVDGRHGKQGLQEMSAGKNWDNEGSDSRLHSSWVFYTLDPNIISKSHPLTVKKQNTTSPKKTSKFGPREMYIQHLLSEVAICILKDVRAQELTAGLFYQSLCAIFALAAWTTVIVFYAAGMNWQRQGGNGHCKVY